MSTELIVNYRGEGQVLRVDDHDIITFPDGLVGFVDWHRFVLIEDPEEAPIGVLQCLDDSGMSFLVTDPRLVAADYRPDFHPEDLESLGIESLEDARVLCILAAKDEPVRVTANLVGPIVINPRTRSARQVILEDSEYSTQHPVLVGDGASA